jgi:hypothetical protein
MPASRSRRLVGVAIAGCLLVLGCLVTAGWSSIHADAMAEMPGMNATMAGQVGAEHSTADVAPHCTDSAQKCQQATVDNSAVLLQADQSSGAAVCFAIPPVLMTTGRHARLPRPPDLHALCVNRT